MAQLIDALGHSVRASRTGRISYSGPASGDGVLGCLGSRFGDPVTVFSVAVESGLDYMNKLLGNTSGTLRPAPDEDARGHRST